MSWYGYEVKDPWWVRIKEWLARHLVCPVVGHRPVRKFGGTIPCRRHDD